MSYQSQLQKARQAARQAQEMLYEGVATVTGVETYIKPNGATGTRQTTFYVSIKQKSPESLSDKQTRLILLLSCYYAIIIPRLCLSTGE